LFIENGAYFLSPPETEILGRLLVTPQRLPNPALVGRAATYVAAQAGIAVPPDTRVLIAELAGVGRDHPLSIEKLCPVLSFYVVADWREGCERCMQILRYGGMGHTMSIHSRSDDVILQFGLKKPAFRIVVNSPATLGAVGLTTGLDPSMTLGCGGWGGNITSDNISPKHLLNIKRIAYETTPYAGRRDPGVQAGGAGRSQADGPPLPKAPVGPKPTGIAAESLARRIDQFLASRGYAPPAPGPSPLSDPRPHEPGTSATEKPVEFVCEDDVRQAIKHSRKIVIGERTIVTPAARDLGEQHQVLVVTGTLHR
jgi:acetaldehyde dehydrogenase (acetylating)